jgi:hypothetical protein
MDQFTTTVPLPLRVDTEDFYGTPYTFLRDGDGNVLLSEAHSDYDDDTLALALRQIVTAVNTHDQLVAALDTLCNGCLSKEAWTAARAALAAVNGDRDD